MTVSRCMCRLAEDCRWGFEKKSITALECYVEREPLGGGEGRACEVIDKHKPSVRDVPAYQVVVGARIAIDYVHTWAVAKECTIAGVNRGDHRCSCCWLCRCRAYRHCRAWPSAARFASAAAIAFYRSIHCRRHRHRPCSSSGNRSLTSQRTPPCSYPRAVLAVLVALASHRHDGPVVLILTLCIHNGAVMCSPTLLLATRSAFDILTRVAIFI